MAYPKGLRSDEADSIRKTTGANVLIQKKQSFLVKFVVWAVSPVSLMLLATAAVSYGIGKVEDFWIIMVLFFMNFGISMWHEYKADSSIEKLQEHLTLHVKTLRDGMWQMIEGPNLVPGDVVELNNGSIVPADGILKEAKNLSINESMLTGESLPRTKTAGETAYSGSFITTGYAILEISAIGSKTYFGKTVTHIDTSKKRSALEQDILSIEKFISLVSIAVIIILTVLFLLDHAPWSDIALLDLSLLIAGIPIALPTVMSLIISIGVVELAKKNVIVRRLASLEDLANVNLLFTDKTGTLTENQIKVQSVVPFGTYDERNMLAFAATPASDPENNPLEHAIAMRAHELGVMPLARTDFVPADSDRKRATAAALIETVASTITLGAPQTVLNLCTTTDAQRETFTKAVGDAARNGFRCLALAISTKPMQETGMQLCGLILLADQLRQDAQDTLSFMQEKGIRSIMVTGDDARISQRIAQDLHLTGSILPRAIINNPSELERAFPGVAGFAEVLPADKYDLVHFAQRSWTVAMTGDGVNDLPAVKAANVGFAVKNAVDALKAGADIVLLSDGIGVIKDAIIEARKIFSRLYHYSLYRISESFRIIITVAVIGLWYHAYPLTPVQLIALAFLNDLPIVSLAFDHVETSDRPAHINPKERFTISTLFGLAGTLNSLILLYIMTNVLHLPWGQIQTMFFLKLTVSGHMLIYVAHTDRPWYKYLPSPAVIWATGITQAIATIFALLGVFVSSISWQLAVLVWIWSFFWMQVSEAMKYVQRALVRQT